MGPKGTFLCEATSIHVLFYFAEPKHAWSKKSTVPTESKHIQYNKSNDNSHQYDKDTLRKYSSDKQSVIIPTDACTCTWEDSYSTSNGIDSAADDEIALLMHDLLSTSPDFQVQIIFYKGFM